MTAHPGKIIGHQYKVIRRLGEGAMGDVYLVGDLKANGTPFALKALKQSLMKEPGFVERFLHEASLGRLGQANIVRLHDLIREPDNIYIVLEYVDGESLGDRIRRGGALPINEALRIFKGLLSALDFAHRNGVIHRDVKPSNILINRQGVPKLCDFGIARQVGTRGLTETGVTLGTPQYMSPEQIKTPQKIDHRSDVYSAGVVLFEMLTGRTPFGQDDADSVYSILEQQIRAEPPDPMALNPSISPGIADILLRSLRKDRNRRIQGCSDFRRALEAQQQGDDPTEILRTSPQIATAALPRKSVRIHMYRHSTGALATVESGIAWPALFFSVFWLLSKGLYSKAALWFGSMVALLVLAIMSPYPLRLLLLAVSAAVYATPGFLGHRWIEEKLQQSGFDFVGEVPDQPDQDRG